MALDFRVAPVVFDKGLDTRSARKLVVAGRWDALVNVSLSETGSVKRRDGFEALVPNLAGTAVALRNNNAVVANQGELYSLAVSGQRSQVPGEMPMLDVRKSEVLSNDTSVDQQDMSADPSAGYACYVWRSRITGGVADSLRVTLVDLNSGAKVLNNQVLISSATATSPRVVFDGGVFFVFYIDGADLFCRVIQPTLTNPLGSQVSLVNDANMSSKNFDADSISTSTLGQRVVVAYMLAAPSATSVQAFICNQTAGVPALIGGVAPVLTAAQVTEASVCGIAVRTFLQSASPRVGFYVLHTAGGALGSGLIGVVTNQGLAIAAAGAVLSGVTPAVSGPCHVTATPVNPGSGEVMQVFFDQQSSYGTANLRALVAVSASAANTVTVNQTLLNSATFRVNAAEASGPQGPFIAGKAFTFGVRTFLPVMMLENYFRPVAPLGANTDTVSAQCSLWLLDTTNIVQSISGTWHLVGGALYGTLGLLDPTLGGGAPTVSTPCSTPLVSGTDAGDTTMFALAALERGRLQLSAGVNMTPVGLSSLSLTPQVGPASRGQLAEWLLFAGGQLGAYDGQQVVQNGFPMYPEGISCVPAAAGSLVVTAGVHQVVAVYEWTDGAGNRHQSAPSLPVTVTVAVNDRIDVLVPTTQLPQNSGWDGNVSTLSIVCYMTEASGITFFRALEGYTPTLNDTGASTVAYTIGGIVMTDDRLAQNEPLYTQPLQAGTTLPNITPGPLHGVCVSKQRLWGFLSDEPGEYTFSQEPTPNTGLRFNPDALGGRLPSTAGEGVAIAELDEKTILFSERAIYSVYGTGPTPSGGFGNFSEPQPVSTDVGCVDPLSVLLMPLGLMFKSQKGWYLLGRDLSVSYIGDGVDRYNEYPVSSAVMMGDRQECRFTSASEQGPTLVYSYQAAAWSVFFSGPNQGGYVTDAVWWPAQDRYLSLHAPAATYPGLMIDTPGQYVDGVGMGAPSRAAIYARTAFLHVAALEGYQRVRMLYLTATADAVPDSDLVIGVDVDDVYSGTRSYDTTVNLGAIAGLNPQSIDLRHKLGSEGKSVQKCKSVAFWFFEGGDTNTGQQPLSGLQALAVEVGIKRGVRRLPAAQNAG